MNCSIRHLCLFSFLAGCATLDPGEIEARREAERLDIYETVFRYQFEHNASGQQQTVDYYLLSMNPPGFEDPEVVLDSDGEPLFLDEPEPDYPPGYFDPPVAFMARFEGHSPQVAPGSMADASEHNIKHENGGSALGFRVGKILWIDDNHVEVDGGYNESRRSSSSNIYILERVDGVWTVTEDILIEIS